MKERSGVEKHGLSNDRKTKGTEKELNRGWTRMKKRSGVDGQGLLNLVQVMGNRLEVMGNPIPRTSRNQKGHEEH